MKTEFREIQKFSQWWLWLILIVIASVPAIGIYKQLILKEDFGSKPLPTYGLFIFLAISLVFLIFFYSLSLKTTITEKEIRMRFIPFLKKRILWKDIESAEIVNYGFVGGWGIRMGTAYGTVYNVKGNKGLAIVLQDGSKFVIGTQKSLELEQFLQKSSRNR